MNDAPLFIVDNRVAGRTVLDLLREWTHSAETLDIATGYFDLGVLLTLDGHWQSIKRIRILIGDETTTNTLKSLRALGDRIDARINKSIEEEKERNPMLQGMVELSEALKNGQIEIRVYYKGKFHAKTLIASDSSGNAVNTLVGSSNFTKPGLSRNIELNVQSTKEQETRQISAWFEEHWADSKPIEDHTIRLIERHTRHYTPFEIYAKALQTMFSSFSPITASDWEENESNMFPKLSRYQQEAYWALMRIAKIHKGAFLCDGVGLGKTFVGLMLIEHFASFRRKNVALLAPKTTRDSVWVPHLLDHLPELGGTSGMADLSNLAVFSHTDFSKRTKGFPGVFEQIEKNVDVVIIDEAHHFRNPGSSGARRGRRPSRYQLLYNMLDKAKREKTIFLLTATPICNSLSDFRHMTELITRKNRHYFNRTLGISDVNKHLKETEDLFLDSYEDDTEAEKMKDAHEILSSNSLISKLVVQRSRKYARESQKRTHGRETVFPKREDPKVAEYSIAKSYGELLDEFKRAFSRDNPLFTLPLYFPLRWYDGDAKKDFGNRQVNTQKQVIGLIRTMFIKRFESSIEAFEISCRLLLNKLLAFVNTYEAHSSVSDRYDSWRKKHGYLFSTDGSDTAGPDEEEISEDEEMLIEELSRDIVRLDRTKYRLDDMVRDAWKDIKQLTRFLEMIGRWNTSHDDKANKLISLLRSRDLKQKKVLIFTEFAHTARYLLRLLEDQGFDGVAQFDGSSNVDRKSVVKRFSPFYNGETHLSLRNRNEKEIRILISTDVLSEGLNLQDATRLINYDIHWSPVRLMQRIGRVDRRMNPSIEEKIKLEGDAEVYKARGTVRFWNFLPPDELNDILSLYKKVTNKTLLISRTFGIEERKLLTGDDNYEPLREFNEAYDGYAHSEMETIHIEYLKLLQNHPELEASLNDLPSAVFSGRKAIDEGACGLFACYRLPVYDEEKNEYLPGGEASWYLYDMEKETIVEEPQKIIDFIRCRPNTPRKCHLKQKDILLIRRKIERHIQKTYIQKIVAPDETRPELVCWLEISR